MLDSDKRPQPKAFNENIPDITNRVPPVVSRADAKISDTIIVAVPPPDMPSREDKGKAKAVSFGLNSTVHGYESNNPVNLVENPVDDILLELSQLDISGYDTSKSSKIEDNVEGLVKLAREALSQSKPTDAKKFLDQARQLQLNNVNAGVMLAKCYLSLGRVYLHQADFKQAKESFVSALELQPNNIHTHLEAGKLYLQAISKLAHNPEVSVLKSDIKEILIASLKIEADNQMDNFLLGTLYFETGELEESLSYIERVVAKDPKNVEAQLMCGKIFGPVANLNLVYKFSRGN